jgi:hypothetical protein
VVCEEATLSCVLWLVVSVDEVDEVEKAEEAGVLASWSSVREACVCSKPPSCCACAARYMYIYQSACLGAYLYGSCLDIDAFIDAAAACIARLLLAVSSCSLLLPQPYARIFAVNAGSQATSVCGLKLLVYEALSY